MKKFSFIVFGLAFLFGSQTAFAATNDYTHYWKFDEGGGRSVQDAIGGQNGVLVGSSTGFGWAGGKINTAFAMDGGAGESVALPNAILKGSQGSISLWLDMMELSDHNIIFSAKSTSDNSVHAALAVDRDGRPIFQYRSQPGDSDRKIQGTRLLNKNEWFHLVFVASGQNYRIFVNGEESVVAGDNIGRWFPDTSNHTFMYRIGMLDATSLNGSWNGYLDDLRIYDRVLTADEVSALYAEGNSGHPTVPAAVAPTVDLTVSQASIPYGGSVVLNWSSKNVDTCTASGSWSEPVLVSGTRVMMKLAGDATYTLSCVGKYGNTGASVHVSVAAKDAPAPVASQGTLTAVPVGGNSGNTPTATQVSGQSPLTTQYARNLTVGVRGEDVRAFQTMLIVKGYLSGTATGYFGPLTKAAAIKLQKEWGLPQTGFIGTMTRAKLNAAN